MVVLHEIEQGSSSSSSSTHNYKYDVFLSFRGADTRYSFTDHLYKALTDANLKTFLDDEEIETGEELKPKLVTAIKASRASIIVLSKNYASSRWCLDELVLILDQHGNSDHFVIPIFFHVEPTDVRKQQKTFGDAMAKHEQRMKEETNAEKRNQLAEKLLLWKKALSQVADLKGENVENRKETEFIEEIIFDIHCKLRVPLISNALPLIGMDDNIKIITSWLTDGSCHTADILTISGISGIGKTSLARYVFNLHGNTVQKGSIFQKSSFLEGINRTCTGNFSGLLDLTKQLYGDISRKLPEHVRDVYEYTSMIEYALARTKVLLVLDDIDCLDQLNALLGNKGFHPGSKIIITTTHRTLAERYALINSEVHPQHTEVCLRGLYETDALRLLCTHAFKRQEPEEGYQEVLKELVRYCGGHPLALIVLGDSLHNEDVAVWEACIEGLKKELDLRIQKAFLWSFNSLPSGSDKDLFKHIACFFVGADKDVTETILEACDRRTRFGIKILIDRSLLTIGWNNNLMMHQLIQELGRDLVRQESPKKPWNRSRLWCHEESFDVLKRKKGNENILGLTLDMKMRENMLHGSSRSDELQTDSLSQMDELLLLQLNYVQMDGSYEKFPKELRWLCMHGFPLKSIPSDLPMENLVALDLSYSNIESFGMCYSNSQPLKRKRKLHGSLKILDLSFCEHLHSLSGFLESPELERLIVRNCTSLVEVCETIEQCVKLGFIDLSFCSKLRKLPRSMRKLKTVTTLLLDGCTSLGDMDSSEIRVASTGLNSQTSSSAIMENIPSVLKFTAIYLPCSLLTLSLESCNLSNESFPNDLSSLSKLKSLCLDDNPIVSMPNCVRSLSSLEKLTMCDCEMLTSIEHPPCTLRVMLVAHIFSGSTSLLRKIIYDPEMAPLNYFGSSMYNLPRSSFEIDGMVKIQPMTGVEEKVFRSLGWKNLDFLKKRRVTTFLKIWKNPTYVGLDMGWGEQEFQTQMYYEFGIFSTFYAQKHMPKWIKLRKKGSSISFITPSSPKKLRGLNFCCVETLPNENDNHCLPAIKISNITKRRIWIYIHCISDESVRVGGKCLIYLSHWMFGMNEMESGDHVTISVIQNRLAYAQKTIKCGVRVVYDEGKMAEEEEEGGDALGCYKSWNHIIGGDLSPFQTTTGEYFLDFKQFQRYGNKIDYEYLPLFDDNTHYKDSKVAFKAFAPRR